MGTAKRNPSLSHGLMLVDVFAHRSFHAQVKEKGGHILLADLKLLKADPAQVQAQSEEIKARYAKIFGV